MNPQIDMNKYLRYLRRVHHMCMRRSLTYMKDFIIYLVTLPLFTIVSLYSIIFTFQASTSKMVAGFHMEEILFATFFSTFIIELAGYSTAHDASLAYQIRQGRLDGLLLKPLHSLFLIIFQVVFFYSIPAALMQLFFLLGVVYWGNIHLSFEQLLSLSFVFFSSLGIYITFLFCVQGVSLYWENNLRSHAVFLMTTTRYPREVFPSLFQKIGISIFPVFLIASPVYYVLQNKYTALDAAYTGFLLIVFTGSMLLLWNNGLKRYTSAN